MTKFKKLLSVVLAVTLVAGIARVSLNDVSAKITQRGYEYEIGYCGSDDNFDYYRYVKAYGKQVACWASMGGDAQIYSGKLQGYRYFRAGTGPMEFPNQKNRTAGFGYRGSADESYKFIVVYVPGVSYTYRPIEETLDANGNISTETACCGWGLLLPDEAAVYEKALAKAGIEPDPVNGTDYNPITNTYSYGIPTENCTAIYIKPATGDEMNAAVKQYKEAYPDLQAAFGNDLRAYTLHYFMNGMYEGRDYGGIWKPNVRE